MAIPPIAPGPDGDGKSRIFDKSRLAALVVLLVLLVLCVAFSWTHAGRHGASSLPKQAGTSEPRRRHNKTLVDLRPWQTAEALAPLAVTAEETEYAHQAEHLADHEVDQAFATALRQANLKAQQSHLHRRGACAFAEGRAA